MTRKLSPLAAIAMSLLALLGAGCGSSGTSTNTSAAQLIAQADPICEQVNLKRIAANKALGHVTTLDSPATLHKVALTAPALATFELGAIERLSALKSTATQTKQWQTILAGMRTLANDTSRLGVYAREGNIKDAQRIVATSQRLQKQLIVLGVRNGFKHCGRLS